MATISTSSYYSGTDTDSLDYDTPSSDTDRKSTYSSYSESDYDPSPYSSSDTDGESTYSSYSESSDTDGQSCYSSYSDADYYSSYENSTGYRSRDSYGRALKSYCSDRTRNKRSSHWSKETPMHTSHYGSSSDFGRGKKRKIYSSESRGSTLAYDIDDSYTFRMNSSDSGRGEKRTHKRDSYGPTYTLDCYMDDSFTFSTYSSDSGCAKRRKLHDRESYRGLTSGYDMDDYSTFSRYSNDIGRHGRGRGEKSKIHRGGKYGRHSRVNGLPTSFDEESFSPRRTRGYTPCWPLDYESSLKYSGYSQTSREKTYSKSSYGLDKKNRSHDRGHNHCRQSHRREFERGKRGPGAKYDSFTSERSLYSPSATSGCSSCYYYEESRYYPYTSATSSKAGRGLETGGYEFNLSRL